jgi:hypothetical protein
MRLVALLEGELSRHQLGTQTEGGHLEARRGPTPVAE